METEYKLKILTSADLAGVREVQRATADLGEALPTDKLAEFERENADVFASLRNLLETASQKAKELGGDLDEGGNQGSGGLNKLNSAAELARGGMEGLAGNAGELVELFGGGDGVAGAVGIAVTAIISLVEIMAKLQPPSYDEWAKEAQASSEAVQKAYGADLTATLRGHRDQIDALVSKWQEAQQAATDYLTEANKAEDSLKSLQAAQQELSDAQAVAGGIDPAVVAEEKAQREKEAKRAAEADKLQREEDQLIVEGVTAMQGIDTAKGAMSRADQEVAAAAEEQQRAREKLRANGIQSDQEQVVQKYGGLQSERDAIAAEAARLRQNPNDLLGIGMAADLEQQLPDLDARIAEIGDTVAKAQEQIAAGAETFTQVPEGEKDGQRLARENSLAQIEQAKAKAASAAADREAAQKELQAAQDKAKTIDPALSDVRTRRDALETRNIAEDLTSAAQAREKAAAEYKTRQNAEYDAVYGAPASAATSQAVEKAAAGVSNAADQTSKEIIGSLNEMQKAMAAMAAAVKQSAQASSEALRLAQEAQRSVQEETQRRRY